MSIISSAVLIVSDKKLDRRSEGNTFIVLIFSLETGLVIVSETPAGKPVTVDGDEHRSEPSASWSSWLAG